MKITFWPMWPQMTSNQNLRLNLVVEGVKLINMDESHVHAVQFVGGVAFWKFWPFLTFDPFTLGRWKGHHGVFWYLTPTNSLAVFSFVIWDCSKLDPIVKNELLTLWPLDDPWGHIKYNFCSYPQGMIVIKFHWNPIKCVEEKTNCQKKQEEPSK